MKINKVTAREVLDSRGNPTVEAAVELVDGLRASAMVPSGASTGKYEAWELRDGGRRYGGQGVLKAVRNIMQKIAPQIKGWSVYDLKKIDAEMLKLDGTANKSKLGANAILAVSLAVARAGALAAKKPLYRYLRDIYRKETAARGFVMPVATMNILNGGRHADNGLSIQEFMIIPRHRIFAERVRMGAEVFHALKDILRREKLVTAVGDEGGFAPRLKNNEAALRLLVQAIRAAGYEPGRDIFLGLDVAASEFYDRGKYNFVGRSKYSAKKMIKILNQWTRRYPLILIEDGLSEDDWRGWQELTAEMNDYAVLVGDDLFVTNPEIFARGIRQDIANAILIKVNQIGSLSETMATIALAKKHGYKIVVSHRSGETADTFIADLAVAVNADFIKTGSLSRSERVEKYNRLMAIERELGLVK